jgi:2'-5' RNA ligase
MPRLFTGLEVPKEVALQLSFLRGGLPGARWIDQQNYHVTLRFIGDIDDVLAREIALLLDQVKRRQFDVRFDEVAAFGGRRPRAIIAAVSAAPALTELQAEHERIMQRVGLEPEGRKYTPHVTLARLRSGSARDIAEYLTIRGGFFVEPFPVDRFVLFSSRNSVGGGPYVVEQTYDLLPAMRASSTLHGESPWPRN